MLDDLKFIHEKDADNALGVAENQWKFLQYEFGLAFKPSAEIRNVVLGGMGGSALYAVFLNSWPRLSVPFEISRDYGVPKYVNENTLFISSSYSGNTEESLEALDEAEQRKAQIVVLAAGGKLAERAEQAGYPLIRVPGGVQPRMSTFYCLSGLIQLFDPLGLIPAGSLRELREAGEWLAQQVSAWVAIVPTAKNQAKQLAQELVGKSIVIYSGPKLAPAANKWKICMNENAKNVAWWNYLSEFNHNEMLGWTGQPVDKPYVVVDLRSTLEHPRVQKRFEVTERMLSGMRPAPEVVQVQGDTIIRQLLWAAALGDFTSMYLAFLNGQNPIPIELVEKFKTELNR